MDSLVKGSTPVVLQQLVIPASPGIRSSKNLIPKWRAAGSPSGVELPEGLTKEAAVCWAWFGLSAVWSLYWPVNSSRCIADVSRGCHAIVVLILLVSVVAVVVFAALSEDLFRVDS